MYLLGILFAFGALCSWAVGDFSIQRASRVTGSLGSLFFVCTFGSIVLLPFVWADIPLIIFQQSNMLLLLLAAVIAFFAAMFDFEALKRGKLAIVQPVIGLELPLTVGFSVFLYHERLTTIEYIAAVAVFIGIMFTVAHDRYRGSDGKIVFERGVVLAGLGAIGLALTNLIVGISSQQISPLLTIWCIHGIIAAYCLFYLISTKRLKQTFSQLRRYPRIIFFESFFDTLGWVCFAYATTMAPIAIVTTVSECYIVLDVLLGLTVNKEKLRLHQYYGIVFAFIGLLLLAFFQPA